MLIAALGLKGQFLGAVWNCRVVSLGNFCTADGGSDY